MLSTHPVYFTMQKNPPPNKKSYNYEALDVIILGIIMKYLVELMRGLSSCMCVYDEKRVERGKEEGKRRGMILCSLIFFSSSSGAALS